MADLTAVKNRLFYWIPSKEECKERSSMSIIAWIALNLANSKCNGFLLIILTLLQMIEKKAIRVTATAVIGTVFIIISNGMDYETDLALRIAGLSVVFALSMINTPAIRKMWIVPEFFTSLFTMLVINDVMMLQGHSCLMLLLNSQKEDAFFTRKACLIITVLCLSIIILFLRCFVKKRMAHYIVANCCMALGMINFFVFSLTKKPFRISDIKLAKTAAGVLGHVSIPKNMAYNAIVCLCFIAIINMFIHFLKNTEPKIKAVSIYLFIMVLLSAVALRVFISKDITQYLLPFQTEYLYSLVAENSIKLREPTNADIYNDTPDINNTTTSMTKEEKPNVIVIMSEAFADMDTVGNTDIFSKYYPFTLKMISDNPSGITYSSVHGNNTVSSELSFLTGAPTFLTAPGATLYKNMTKETDSIVSVLKNEGYKTYGVHPYLQQGYDRDKAWEFFGFDNMEFMQDFKEPSLIRDYISDKDLFDRTFEIIKDDTNPVFCFAVTMQNHATYDDDLIERADVKGFEDFREITEWTALQSISDKSLKEFIDEIDRLDEPTYVLFFGDHQPMIETEFYERTFGKKEAKFSDDEIRKKYQIPYFIYNNTGRKFEVPAETSMNYLSSILLNSIGIKNDWFEWIRSIQEVVPVITDNFVKLRNEWIHDITWNDVDAIKEDDNENAVKLKQYQVYCWNLLH